MMNRTDAVAAWPKFHPANHVYPDDRCRQLRQNTLATPTTRFRKISRATDGLRGLVASQRTDIGKVAKVVVDTRIV